MARIGTPWTELVRSRIGMHHPKHGKLIAISRLDALDAEYKRVLPPSLNTCPGRAIACFKCACGVYACTSVCSQLNAALIAAAPKYCSHEKLQRRTSVYENYAGMMSRCLFEYDSMYPAYGGSGISVCARWRLGEGTKTGFQCFVEDMAPSEHPHLSLDRIDNAYGYSPENCRWATIQQQNDNRRNSTIVHVGGVKKGLLTAIKEACGDNAGPKHSRNIRDRIYTKARHDWSAHGGDLQEHYQAAFDAWVKEYQDANTSNTDDTADNDAAREFDKAA